jgi:glycosyltransferase involved in cell wall biosynthesis
MASVVLTHLPRSVPAESPLEEASEAGGEWPSPRRLRLLQVTSSRNGSGGTLQALLLSKALHEEGCRVLFCAPPGSGALERAELFGLPVEPLSFGGVWCQGKASRRLRSLARSWDAELVHTHHNKAHNAALLATFGGGFPPIVVNRGVIYRPEFPAKFRSGRTRAIIVNSARAGAVLQEHGVRAGKIHVVLNGQEAPDREAIRARAAALRGALGLFDGVPVVGCVGTGRAVKGFQFAVEAAPRILEEFPSAVFVLVGGGTERLLPRIRELNLEHHFRLTGHRSDALDVMALFDVYVFASVDMDSCPNVVLEAMGLERPIAAADMGGVGEMLVEGETGRLFPPGDVGELAAAVCGLLRDPEGATRMGKAAAEAAASRFSLEAKVRKTLSVYGKVLSGSTERS